MYPGEPVVKGVQEGGKAVSTVAQRGHVLALQTDFDGIPGHLVVQMLKAQQGVGETVLQRIGIFLQNPLRGMDRTGVHNELGVVFTWQAGGVGHHEAGRAAAVEGGDRLHILILFQN